MSPQVISNQVMLDFGFVKAGTSHIRVIQLPSSRLNIAYIQRKILGVHIFQVNSGYQDRKLVFFSRKNAGIDFLFVQLDLSGNIQSSVKECCSSAVAIAYALQHDGWGNGCLKMTNINSKQEFIIRQKDPARFIVRLVLDHRQLLSKVRPLNITSPFQTVWKAGFSNPYIFALHGARSRDEAFADLKGFLSGRKASSADPIAKQKILVMCDAEDLSDVGALCYYQGELHRSLPGSGMLWAGAMLTALMRKKYDRINTYRFRNIIGALSTRNFIPAPGSGGTAWMEYEANCLKIN